eukprot:3525991-Pyramimonas_sp.AAC.1
MSSPSGEVALFFSLGLNQYSAVTTKSNPIQPGDGYFIPDQPGASKLYSGSARCPHRNHLLQPGASKLYSGSAR